MLLMIGKGQLQSRQHFGDSCRQLDSCQIPGGIFNKTGSANKQSIGRDIDIIERDGQPAAIAPTDARRVDNRKRIGIGRQPARRNQLRRQMAIEIAALRDSCARQMIDIQRQRRIKRQHTEFCKSRRCCRMVIVRLAQ